MNDYTLLKTNPKLYEQRKANRKLYEKYKKVFERMAIAMRPSPTVMYNLIDSFAFCSITTKEIANAFKEFEKATSKIQILKNRSGELPRLSIGQDENKNSSTWWEPTSKTYITRGRPGV